MGSSRPRQPLACCFCWLALVSFVQAVWCSLVMEVQLRTKLTSYSPSTKKQSRTLLLRRSLSPVMSLEQFVFDMVRRGWVDLSIRVPPLTPPKVRKCSCCGGQEKPRRDFSRAQWTKSAPECKRCTAKKVSLEKTRSEDRRRANLAEFCPPQPRPPPSAVVLPRPLPPPLGQFAVLPSARFGVPVFPSRDGGVEVDRVRCGVQLTAFEQGFDKIRISCDRCPALWVSIFDQDAYRRFQEADSATDSEEELDIPLVLYELPRSCARVCHLCTLQSNSSLLQLF